MGDYMCIGGLVIRNCFVIEDEVGFHAVSTPFVKIYIIQTARCLA